MNSRGRGACCGSAENDPAGRLGVVATIAEIASGWATTAPSWRGPRNEFLALLQKCGTLPPEIRVIVGSGRAAIAKRIDFAAGEPLPWPSHSPARPVGVATE